MSQCVLDFCDHLSCVCTQVLLPTCLRDFVPAVHWALLTLTFVLRQLDGQVLSKFEAQSKHVLPGSRAVQKKRLRRLQLDMIRGLTMVEGCIPACHLNPLLHRFLHYVSQTAKKGRLGWLAMWVFERLNKKIKNFVRNRQQLLSGIASAVKLDIATRFMALAAEYDDTDHEAATDPVDTCFLKGRSRFHA